MANAPTSLEDVISKDDLESRYINEHFCGSGAFGNVHKFGIKPQFAKTAQHKRIAVKTNKDEDRGADREIQSLVTLLDEPHIVNLISYSRSPSLIVMECCACDLDSYIKQKRFDISLKDLLKFWNEALHSLKSLKEKGILHRDVKPNNFLVDFRGTDGSNVQLVTFKLGDFGCGRKINKGRMDRGEIDDLTKNLGTNGFISPEIAPLLGKDDSSGAYTYQSDLWSLSVVVFYIASRGKKPFTVQRLLSLHQEINTDSKRNSDIKAIVGEHLVDSFSSIFSILVETLKWSPVERYTAEKCLHIVEHLQKQDDHSALVQKPLVVRPAAAISTPDEEKKKQMKKEQEREENQLENIDANMFIKGLDSYTDAVEREETTFNVKVKDPNAPVDFYINGKKVSKSDTRCKYVNVGEGKHQLILHNIKMEDMGTIEARTPSNRGDEMLTSSTKFEVAMGEHAPEVGDCGPVTGIPNKECCWKLPYKCEGVQQSPLVVTVMFRGKELKIGLDVNVIIHQDDIELSVINPKREKSGIYTVTMKNAQGESSRDINVNIGHTAASNGKMSCNVIIVIIGIIVIAVIAQYYKGGCNGDAHGIACCGEGFTTGDNAASEEIFIQPDKYQSSCSETCKSLYPLATGVTKSLKEYYPSGSGKNRKKCWCEFGNPIFDPQNVNYQTCVFRE